MNHAILARLRRLWWSDSLLKIGGNMVISNFIDQKTQQIHHMMTINFLLYTIIIYCDNFIKWAKWKAIQIIEEEPNKSGFEM